jgi:hypothetical protein
MRWVARGGTIAICSTCLFRSNQSHRTYDNQCPGESSLDSRPPDTEFSLVNDVLIHPNQGELISADQNGNIKQWVLSTNECDLELVETILPSGLTHQYSLAIIGPRSRCPNALYHNGPRWVFSSSGKS